MVYTTYKVNKHNYEDLFDAIKDEQKEIVLEINKQKRRLHIRKLNDFTKDINIEDFDFENINDIFNKKSLYPKVWLHFCVKHGGLFWFVHFLYRYIKIILKLLLNK